MGEIFRQEHSAATLTEPADHRIARLHRAYLARSLANGADVLDLHGADGSTAALIAQRARHVTALVDDPLAAHAAFPAANLTFLPNHPAPPATPFDLVLAFGLLERAADPAALLADLQSRLRPDGRLLLDAPHPDSAPHPNHTRHSFTPPDLLHLLHARFAHTRLYAQRGLIGSALLDSAPAAPTLFTHRDTLHAEASATLPHPDSLIALASAAPLDGAPGSLLIDADIGALAALQARAVQAEFELHALRHTHAEITAELGRTRRTDAQWRHDLAVLRVSEAAAGTHLTAVAVQRDAYAQTLMTTIRRLEHTESAHAQATSALVDHHAQAIAAVILDRDQAQAECARLRALPPPAPPSWRARLRPKRARIAALRRSPLFDAHWYLARNDDVRAADIDPASHYLLHGAAEGRDPGPEFNAAWYASQHLALAASGLTPIEFHERDGRALNWPTAPAPPDPIAEPEPEPAPEPEPPPVRPPNPRVLFVAGESDTPGAQYRCARYAQAATQAGWSAGWSKIEQTGAIELVGVQILVLWRVRYSRHVEGVMAEIRNAGGIVVFDVDDLMIRPELANTRIIDGIRTTNAGIGSTRETFAQVQQAMLHADLCTTTTDELAQHMREWQKAAYILPNGYDAATLHLSRRAVRARAAAPSDGLIRIGYAAGTVTHQKDFAVALPGLVRVLQTRPRVRLVLFRAPGTDLVVVDEFDSLTPYADRIEWRDKVDLAGLPAELARFDINIAPLELGNPFCEAKSELKYFEAALVGVPTIASPTGPFARAIRHNHTGLLAADDDAWHQSLLRLVDDADLRQIIGRHAYIDCLWRFGPQRRAEIVDSFLNQITGTRSGARDFALDILQHRDQQARPAPAPTFTAAQILFRADRMADAAVTVIVPCYNYADTIIEALDSVRLQTLEPLDLIVIDDASTDPLVADLLLEWAKRHEARFNRLLILRHAANAGLSAARNTGFEQAETGYVLPLDADNRLRPTCCATLLQALSDTPVAYAYGSVQMFGAADAVFCDERYQPARFIGGNYIDAMALIAKWAWSAAGGYDMPRHMGWEDFDLWCRLAELGQRGRHVAEILADYRVHNTSMLTTMVEVDTNKQAMVALIEHRHDWLRLSSRAPHERV